MKPSLKTAALAGLVSCSLFLLVFGFGLGFLFMFLPSLPLFYAGFCGHPNRARDAALMASAVILLLSGPGAVTVYLLLLGLPATYICQRSRLSRQWKLSGAYEGHYGREWFPIGQIFTRLTLWGVGLTALITAFYWSEEGGLPGVLAASIRGAFTGIEDEYAAVVDTLAEHWSFLIFPTTLWLWCMMLYAHAWLAHRMAQKRGLAARPDMAVVPFDIPGWMLQLLAIAALASLLGSPSLAFLGKATLVSLMLPYFFMGAARLREMTQNWPNPRFFLFFVYFMVFTQLWPALLLAMVGLWQQIKVLSVQETSTKK